MTEPIERHHTSVSTTVSAPAVITASALTNLLREWVSDALDPRPVLGIVWGGPESTLEAQVTAKPASERPTFVHIGRVLIDDFEAATDGQRVVQPLQLQVAIDSQIAMMPTVLKLSVTPMEDACRVTVTHDGWPPELERLAGPQAWEERLTRLPAVARRIQNEASH